MEFAVRILLFVIAVITFLLGMLTMLISKTSIHEIQAWVMLLISAVTLSGAGVVEAINLLRAEVRDGQKRLMPPPT